jgi:hypothetical protein
MKGPAIFVAIGILSVGTAVAAAQSDTDIQPVSGTTQAQNAANGPLENGSPIHVALKKAIDSDKVKQGHTVTARTVQPTKANGKTVIPSGAIIEGHITQASSCDKGACFSTVGIVFDKATLKNGEQIPLNVIVKAIALPQTPATGPPNPGTDTAPLGDGAPQGGADRQPGRPAAIAAIAAKRVGHRGQRRNEQRKQQCSRNTYRRAERQRPIARQQPGRLRFARHRLGNAGAWQRTGRGDHFNRQSSPSDQRHTALAGDATGADASIEILSAIWPRAT